MKSLSKLVLILACGLLPSCMTTTDAKGNTVRKVDPEARKFYGGLVVRAYVLSAK